ncbi:MAG: SDR family oxidoreductase, partial [Bacteroidales bacterium]
IGLACAKMLAKKKYNLVLIHRDSRSMQKLSQVEFDKIRNSGIELYNINVNANTDEAFIKLKELLSENNIKSIKAFIHAYADANIGSILESEKELSADDFIHSFNSMALSFVTWSKWLKQNNYLQNFSKIIGFTSEGSFRVLNNYVAVGMAKSALESACKYLAIEFAPYEINVNLINSGIVFSKSVELMEKQKPFIEKAIKRNPFKRLTEPSDIAKVVSFLISDDSNWITGQKITVDGGEQLLSI